VVKRSGGTTWVAVDGGMSDNPRPALYGAATRHWLANRADEPPAGTYAVCGKHCETETWIEHASLPSRDEGDLLAVPATARTARHGEATTAMPFPPP
jgi:diaminopimelate decarboxylase